MPFTLSQLSSSRPFLYHLTARANLPGIAESLTLRCANTLLAEAGLAYVSSKRRLEHLAVTSNGRTTLLRDQKPLIEGAIDFEEDWDLARFVQHVNEHVFFWPGRTSEPIKPGLNHFERYRTESPAVLRFPITELRDAALRFSRYNSGAPRCSGGQYSPRGSRTYLTATEFTGTPSEVVEVVTVGSCKLPRSVQVADNPKGPWRPLLNAAM